MICHRCGERYDLDSIHEEIKYNFGEEVTELREKYHGHPRRHRHDDPFQADYERLYFNPAVTEFRKNGCGYFGSRCNVDSETSNRSMVLSAIGDVMGGDVDGFESMIEDAEQLGLL